MNATRRDCNANIVRYLFLYHFQDTLILSVGNAMSLTGQYYVYLGWVDRAGGVYSILIKLKGSLIVPKWKLNGTWLSFVFLVYLFTIPMTIRIHDDLCATNIVFCHVIS